MADWQLSLDSVDRAWPFVVGGIVCLVTTVSVRTEKERMRDRERRKKKEEREREESRLIAG